MHDILIGYNFSFGVLFFARTLSESYRCKHRFLIELQYEMRNFEK